MLLCPILFLQEVTKPNVDDLVVGCFFLEDDKTEQDIMVMMDGLFILDCPDYAFIGFW